MKISFDVYDKPPKKSQWGKDNAKLVIKLRESALKARTKAGMTKYYTGLVKLNLIVYAPNINNVNYIQTGNDDPNKFGGDLDSLVAGICDYLRKASTKPGENKFKPHPLFDDRPEIGPEVPLIIFDDAQIVEINAKKKEDDTTHYHVEIIFL